LVCRGILRAVVFLLAEGLGDLLGGLVLGDAVLLGDLVGKAVLVAGNRGKVFGGELVESRAKLLLGYLVSHG